MLRDNLYNLTTAESNDTEARFLVHINAGHPVFKGHFPSQPVLPGVCTLTMLRDAASLYVKRPVRFNHIRECKFISVVNPQTSGTLELRITVSEREIKALVSAGEQTVLKLKASYTWQDE